MIYAPNLNAILVFALFVGTVLGLSFYLAGKAKSAKGYYAAHGEIPWFINGIAFAGDYLSAASFLGICGMIAFFGYDGFLYSIGFLAGWVVALFVIAEPIKRLGKFTFADALDSQFNSRGIKLSAAISTLIVSVFYLIPQMVGAGALIKPLLGIPDIHLGFTTIPQFTTGVVLVGAIVILITVTAGMVSTTWVQFIKGSLLVLFCATLTIAILNRGLTTDPSPNSPQFRKPAHIPALTDDYLKAHNLERLPETGPWKSKPYVRLRDKETGLESIWRKTRISGWTLDVISALPATETQYILKKEGQPDKVNGKNQGSGKDEADFFPIGHVASLGSDHPDTPEQAENPNAAAPENVDPDAPPKTETGPLGPFAYLRAVRNARITLWQSEEVSVPSEKAKYVIYYPVVKEGSTLLVPGNHPMFAGIASSKWPDRLNFISLMLALFCGTAALPHILIRYYTVKDQASARKSTVVGIIAIGFFYVLTLYLGLGAMTSGMMDPTDTNMAAPLLAKSFGNFAFAFISAIAFTTVLGTVSGLIMAASGTVAHDLMHNLLQMNLDDHQKVRAGKIASVVVGICAIILGILFQKMNVSFLVGWAFNIAASANLPAIVMLLFWKRTTAKGITASILVGLLSSLIWIFLSGDAYSKLYNLPAARAPMPFNQPGLVTIPLAFLTLIVVSLVTSRRTNVAPPPSAVNR